MTATPEVGRFVINERTGNLYLVFETGRMVRIDEPLQIVTFGGELPPQHCEIELPAETRKVVFDIYKAVKDTAVDNKNE
jgi:hypothetical protein